MSNDIYKDDRLSNYSLNDNDEPDFESGDEYDYLPNDFTTLKRVSHDEHGDLISIDFSSNIQSDKYDQKTLMDSFCKCGIGVDSSKYPIAYIKYREFDKEMDNLYYKDFYSEVFAYMKCIGRPLGDLNYAKNIIRDIKYSKYDEYDNAKNIHFKNIIDEIDLRYPYFKFRIEFSQEKLRDLTIKQYRYKYCVYPFSLKMSDYLTNDEFNFQYLRDPLWCGIPIKFKNCNRKMKAMLNLNTRKLTFENV